MKKMKPKQLLGPFSQIVTMDQLPEEGPLQDRQLAVVRNGGLLIENGNIVKVLSQREFVAHGKELPDIDQTFIPEESVLIPGLIDAHTHICYAGSREDDYARRLAGETYLEIARKGGGIFSTVTKTREASPELLAALLLKRARTHLKRGITTCEVKSGYGLNLESELKMLRVINQIAGERNVPDLVATCLSAHVKPKEFKKHAEYLDFVISEILPAVKQEQLSQRVDIFVEQEAFDVEMSIQFARHASSMGFSVIVHADQFSSGGSKVAAEVKAISADHLEASTDQDLDRLKQNGVIAVVLPGASMGLGMPYAPARRILDTGLSLVIASDWNPGSAPMGELLLQGAVMGAAEKLTLSETLAAMTVRAARALGFKDRGVIQPGCRADMIAFPCRSHREIFYHQGSLCPHKIWKQGELIDTLWSE